MDHNGVLIILSGFSGAGKGTVVKELMKRHDTYSLSVSATTRAPRENKATGLLEQHGVEYFFLEKDEFTGMIEREEFIEYAEYRGNYYGTPRKYVEEQLLAGRDVILEIDVQGGVIVKEKFPEAVLVFVTAPSAKELRSRLVNRGTETEEEVLGRLARAVDEADYIPKYDYLLINDELTEAVDNLHTIVTAEHHRLTDPNRIRLAEEITKDLKELTKEA